MHFAANVICVLFVVIAITSADDFYNSKRTPLGTMRFGKRGSALDDYLLSEQILEEQKRGADETAERSIRAPLGTMRFGKRSQPMKLDRTADFLSEYLMSRGH